jgi:hypothetical protein
MSMMAAVIECLPNSTGASRRLPAPDAPGVRARHHDDDDASATSPEDDVSPRATADPPLPDDAALCPPTTLPHEEYRRTDVKIHVGNMRTEGRTGRRPEGAEDRRVDRGTPLGNPFPIDMTDDSARETACEAYATLVQGDPESLTTYRRLPYRSDCVSTDDTHREERSVPCTARSVNSNTMWQH